MKKFTVSSENGPTIFVHAMSARNARFMYSLQYRLPGIITVKEV